MSLVGWWPLDGTAGDRVGGNDGAATDINWVDGKIGQAAELTSGASEIRIPHNDRLSKQVFGTAEVFSFSAWIRMTSWDSYGTIVQKATGGYWSHSTAGIWTYSGGLAFIIGSNEPENPDGSYSRVFHKPSLNEWHHVAGVADGELLKLYVDGDLKGTAPTADVTRKRSHNTAPIMVGPRHASDSGDFRGKMSDLKIYDHALSHKEVSQLSQAKALHYPFDQEAYSRSVPDTTGRGYDGRVVRSPQATTDTAIGSRAVNFGSGSNAVVVDNPPDFANANELTISLWAKSNQSSWQNTGTFASRRSSNQFVLHPDGNSQNVDWYVNTEEQGWENVSHSPADIESWNHYALTFGDGTLTGYLNGENIGTTDAGATLTSATGPITIGRDDDGDTNYGNEKMTDVRFYAEALSAEEIQSLSEQRASIDAGGTMHAHELRESNSISGGSFESEDVGATLSNSPNLSFETSSQVVDTDARFGGQSLHGISPGETRWNRIFIVTDAAGNSLMKKGETWTMSYYAKSTNSVDLTVGFAGGGGYLKTTIDANSDWKRYEVTDTISASSNQFQRRHSTVSDGDVFFDTVQFRHGTESAGVDISSEGTLNASTLNEIGPAADSLVGWWPLDGHTRDLSENRNDGTNNGASVVGGLGQSAYEFDTVHEYIDFNNQNISSLTQFTWSCYVYKKGNNNAFNIIGVEGGNNAYISMKVDVNGRLSLHKYQLNGNDDIDVAETNQIINNESWHHCVVTYDQGETKTYIDGNLEASGAHVNDSYPTRAFKANYSSNVGSTFRYYFGKIQDVRIYDRALSDAEVAQLYALTDPREDQQLMQTQDGQALVSSQFSDRL